MSITGYYDGTAVRVDRPLQMNQKVIVIPVEGETDLGESAAFQKTVPEEIQELIRHWGEIDKSKLIELLHDQRRMAEDDGIIIVQVDDLRERVDALDLRGLINFTIEEDESLSYGSGDDEALPYGSGDDEALPYGSGDDELLSHEAEEELKNQKLYGKAEIMQLLGCGEQKALNFLKLLFQLEYAIKIGKNYIVTAEEFDRFFKDFKGKEISL